MKKFHAAFFLPVFLMGVPIVEADTDDVAAEKTVTETIQPLFCEDRITTQVVTGFLTSDTGIGPDVENFNYSMTNIRTGWMLNDVMDAGAFSGNVEAIVELSSNIITHGPGNYMVGPTALVRYNFVQPGWKIIPYVQGGAGFVLTDAYEDHSQSAIGQFFEFTPQASVGMRWLVNEQWSVDIEGIYHHVSNAGMADRNLGLNSMGGLVGFTYFYDKLWK